MLRGKPHCRLFNRTLLEIDQPYPASSRRAEAGNSPSPLVLMITDEGKLPQPMPGAASISLVPQEAAAERDTISVLHAATSEQPGVR
jgi:hypothetical protein